MDTIKGEASEKIQRDWKNTFVVSLSEKEIRPVFLWLCRNRSVDDYNPIW